MAFRYFQNKRAKSHAVTQDAGVARQKLADGYVEITREEWLPLYQADRKKSDLEAEAARKADEKFADRNAKIVKERREKRYAVLSRLGVKQEELELFK